MKNQKQHRKAQKVQPQPQEKLQSRQFLLEGKLPEWKKMLVPGSIVISTLLVIASIVYSYTVIFKQAEVITRSNFKSSLVDVIKTAQGSGSAESTDTTDPASFQNVTTEIDDDPIAGDKNSTNIVIVEFSDYECPYCKRHFTQSHNEIIKNYIDTKKAVLVFRDYPLDFHDPMATQEAIAAECVQELNGDAKYFEYHDKLFTNTTSNGNGLNKPQLYDFAEQIGVNRGAFTSCFDSQKYLDEVKKDIAAGNAAGVSGTPSFVIGKLENGKVTGKLVPGAYPYETFKAVLDSYIK